MFSTTSKLYEIPGRYPQPKTYSLDEISSIEEVEDRISTDFPYVGKVVSFIIHGPKGKYTRNGKDWQPPEAIYDLVRDFYALHPDKVKWRKHNSQRGYFDLE